MFFGNRKRQGLLPKGVPLPEIIRQEEEWKTPPPVDSDSIESRITICTVVVVFLLVIFFFPIASANPPAALAYLILLPLYYAGVCIYSLKIGRKVDSYKIGILLFIIIAELEMVKIVFADAGILGGIEDELAERHTWLRRLCFLYIPCFILTVIRPFSTLVALFARRIRCTKEVKSEFKGCGYADISAYQSNLEGFVGAAHYHYESDGAVYVAVYRDHLNVMYPRGSDNFIKIDPDYPEYYYDPATAKELRGPCFCKLFIGLLLFALMVLNVAILGFDAFDL